MAEADAPVPAQEGNDDAQTQMDPTLTESPPKPGIVEVQAHHDADEVAKRLFAAPDLNAVQEEAKSLWGWMSSQSATLKSRAQALAEQAAPLADSIKHAAEMAETKRREALEQVRAAAAEAGIDMSHLGGGGGAGAGTLPWDAPSAQQFRDAIRDRVLELSRDDKTFLVPPPEAVGFEFEFERRAQDALAVMETDARLQEQRFKLVPKDVSETEFWRNYFYRVALILDAYRVEQDAPVEQQQQQQGAPEENEHQPEQQQQASDDKAQHELDLDLNLNLNLHDDDEEGGGAEDEDNFDMLDDDELLASAGIEDDDDDDDEADGDLEARINAELSD